MKTINTLAAVLAFTFSSLSFATPVNINTADAELIAESLTGVGMVKAQAIIEYRNKNGGFGTTDQIILVRGIGESTYQKNKADILLK